MQLELVVVQPFGTYAKGDRITDATDIATTLAGPHAHHVVKVQVAQQKA